MLNMPYLDHQLVIVLSWSGISWLNIPDCCCGQMILLILFQSFYHVSLCRILPTMMFPSLFLIPCSDSRVFSLIWRDVLSIHFCISVLSSTRVTAFIRVLKSMTLFIISNISSCKCSGCLSNIISVCFYVIIFFIPL